MSLDNAVVSGRLASLAGLVAFEPAMADLLTGNGVSVAVPEVARAVVLAGLVAMGSGQATSDSSDGSASKVVSSDATTKRRQRKILVVTPTANESEHLSHDLAAFVGPGVVAMFRAWETLPFERVSPAAQTMGSRLEVISAIASGKRPSVVVAPVKALLQRLTPGVADRRPIIVERGQVLQGSQLIEALVDCGYRREYQVEHRGEFAVRGGIIDVFPSTAEHGIRIDLFGDEVDRLTSFDVSDQRSMENLDLVAIHGCREFLLGKRERSLALDLAKTAHFASTQFSCLAEGELFDGMESFLPWLDDKGQLLTDFLQPDDRVVLVEPRRMRDRAVELAEEEEALASSLSVTWGIDDGETLPRLHFSFERLLEKCPARVVSMLSVADGPTTPHVRATGWPLARGDASVFAKRFGELRRSGYTVVACADSPGGARRLVEVLQGERLDVTDLSGVEAGSNPTSAMTPKSSTTATSVKNTSNGGVELANAAARSGGTADLEGLAVLRKPGVYVVVQQLDRGFILDGSKLAVLAEPDLTGRRRPHRVPRVRRRAVEGFFDDLAPGSYVVHHVHGVARFAGMVRRSIAGAERDYLLLEYRGDDKLYVPSDQIDAVTPYTSGEQPALSRMGGGDWQRSRAKARQAVHEVAQELVVLYRRRLATTGYAFSPDTPWQTEVEQSFPYLETPDQLRAITEVKADMENPVPMDRLVCGDVGFGKTEVALRAAFKATQDNKQVAVLVPTTLLAQQHYQTFSDRFAPYPLKVEMLSRFLTQSEARKVVDGVASGAVDVVVGTHSLLSQGIHWKDLGLVIVDEEQRFGVSHKEALKALSVGIDILTLTASPIPRTLEMGLTGIRDLSIIDTPPAARQPILTFVGELDQRAIAEAIRRELLREGQVFFVHNRVLDIDRVAREVAELVPEAKVGVAHGRMDEGSLEKVVLDFADGAYDVLVCTTIVESGIDMPNVNTLVVDRADLLGLGQLHQLRGRVGRSGQRAYAYLFHPADRVLSELAYERLRTIGELTELGSGFKIAMRDLEIRGAGNLLGTDQSGHIAAIGYDLYVKMVAEAVAELKGEQTAEPAEIKLELPVDAHLPKEYVTRDDLRLEAYRRLSSVRDVTEVDDIEAEWVDRYGPMPLVAKALLAIARLRAQCLVSGVREVTVVPVRPGTSGFGRPGEFDARLSPLTLKASGRVRLTRLYPKAIWKDDASQLVLTLPRDCDIATVLAGLIADLMPAEQVRLAVGSGST